MAQKKKKKKRDNSANRPKVFGVILFLLALLLLVSLITHRTLDDNAINSEANPFEIGFKNQAGMLGAYLSYLVLGILGWLSFFIPFGLIISSLKLFKSEIADKLKLNSFLLFIISLVGTMIFNIHIMTAREISIENNPLGGYVGEKLTLLFIQIAGGIGSYIVLAGIVAILLILYTSITPLLAVKLKLPGKNLAGGFFGPFWTLTKRILSFNWLLSLLESKKNDDESEESSSSIMEKVEYAPEPAEQPPAYIEDSYDDDEDEEDEPQVKTAKKQSKARPAEQLQLSNLDYMYPSVEFLASNPVSGTSVSKDEMVFTARMLKDTLETFNVRVEGEISFYPGPIITRYEFKPGTGIKINQIINLADDLALALKAKRIRIIAPIPGKAAVGVEIPNRNTQMVYLRDIIESEEFKNSKHILPLAFGKTTSGQPFVADLAKMPHLLIAGATGSGKSVGMNIMVTSLLYRLHPQQIRFIFIDPKMLELSVYTGIPHLGRPVVTKPKRAEKVLSDAVVEMERRYRKLANASVRNIADFNKKQTEEEKKLPYIVICVDELADLMMSATSSKIEMLITRLAQMSRAVGIHLILATQRPSVDVITGLIKANFPARIAYQVSTKVDSRTIIDANGAEKLLGNGDMLFLETGQPEARRIHGAYLSSEETEKIVTFINDQGIEMMALEGISQSTGEPTETEVDLGDPLFKEACEVVIRHKQGSVSLLQRRLGIGYQRAARLIDKLEQAGIVSSFDGSKAREVLVDKSYLETLFVASGGGQAPETSPTGSNEN